MLKRVGAVFHVLFGGTCRPWNLRTQYGRWPGSLSAPPAGDDLRLIGTTSLVPGQTKAARERARLRVLRRARIGSAPALVLRNAPYPAGGIHGGHISIIWNAHGAGYVVSGHAVASAQRPDSVPGPRAVARASDTLIAVGRSMRQPRVDLARAD